MNDELSSADRIAIAIEKKAALAGGVGVSLILEVEDALQHYPDSLRLWILRGNFIQIGDDDPRWSLEDAESSYQKAALLDPANPLPLVELGYFYDRVLDDPAKAKSFFRRAIELGGGDSAIQGLRDVLEQLK